jgi:hypothetical protein
MVVHMMCKVYLGCVNKVNNSKVNLFTEKVEYKCIY